MTDEFMSHVDTPELCPDGPHRGPEGPGEDVAQCPRCLGVSFSTRSERS